ncbi:MAG: 4-phosphoerythronate dehydrogenase ['Candidatus Kapabacteria' thiocyanatum]|uniref:Erythronate-4-phosphate dehydrogenase n=1 Tax=Candidatus Kapaibacterium thiocyanatum TaxID=1895771 RepID=A0A1M3L3R1_9BACT|nr:4-phosphoerythronate dehydrogenase ['Candidatus Kapabacteria' thiocyanatum]OJX59989.1 MAG: hypothetical protein BGO89_08340 ['Candidatus Kapabacteria' thiocyanatum]
MIIIDANIPLLADLLSPYDDVRIVEGRHLRRDDIIDCDADTLLVRSTTKVGRTLLDGTNVGFIATATAGMDHMDLSWLSTHSIAVASAPGSNAAAVAEYVVAAMLEWSTLLEGRTIGIVGCGNVGRRIVDHARALGMDVVVNDPPLRDAGIAMPAPHMELDELLTIVDVLTVHTPLVVDVPYPTAGLIDAARLRKLRDEALVINAARGGIIDEAALLDDVLRTRRALVLDVFANEPSIDTALLPHTLVATPHVAGHTLNGKYNGARMIGEAWLRWKDLPTDIFLEAVDAVIPKPSVIVDTDTEALRDHLRVNRPLVEDTARFVHGMIADPSAATFDRLRNTYPQRAETLVSINP